MPRLTRRLPKYCSHRGNGQAYVSLAGEIVYLGKYGTAASRNEFDRVTAEYLANGRR